MPTEVDLMRFNREEWFFNSAAMLLILTAVAKFCSAAGTAKILLQQDQLLHVNIRLLMLGAAASECAIAFFLLRSRHELKRALALFWLSGNFMAYRFANQALGIHYCPCLGTLAQNLPLTQARLDLILTVLVIYWFLGSSYILWRAWVQAQEAAVEAQMKERLTASA